MARTTTSRLAAIAAGATAALLALTGCVAGEDAPAETGSADGGTTTTVDIDWATYNPLSIVIRDQGWLEDAGYDVNWVQSLGSSAANEALRSGAIDFGSTAGSAALLARANGAPQQIVTVVAQPEWASIVTGEGSDIASVEQLQGRTVAAALGTDPYFFLVQSLEQAGLSIADVTVENLAHADGWAALQGGSVDAWAGLDPITATAEASGATILATDLSLNSYSVLNASEEIIEQDPELVQTVVDLYEQAREWALANSDEMAQLLADAAAIDLSVAQVVIDEREGLDVSGVPGDELLAVLEPIGAIQVEIGDVASQDAIDTALDSLLAPDFAAQAVDAG